MKGRVRPGAIRRMEKDSSGGRSRKVSPDFMYMVTMYWVCFVCLDCWHLFGLCCYHSSQASHLRVGFIHFHLVVSVKGKPSEGQFSDCDPYPQNSSISLTWGFMRITGSPVPTQTFPISSSRDGFQLCGVGSRLSPIPSGISTSSPHGMWVAAAGALGILRESRIQAPAGKKVEPVCKELRGN